MWHTKPIPNVVEELYTSFESGLTSQEAQSRLEEYGPNRLQERPRPDFMERLWGQLNDFLILILIVAAIVSALLGWNDYRTTGHTTEFVEPIAIMTIVVLNAVLGMVQEGKAEEALEALREMAAPTATVIRDGHRQKIPGAEVVPGDLVVLDTGDRVTADVRLVQSANLRIEEASLTGESVPVEKYADDEVAEDAGLGDRTNCAYSSTMVTYGRGRGIVFATGMATEIGKIADMIQSTEDDPTPLQIKLAQLGKWLGIIALTVCGIVGVLGIVRDTSLGILFSEGFGPYWADSGETVIEMFMIAVSLAIAAVPEGLPAVVTICLALGMQEMVKRNALIRQLPAVETLGSSTAICSDKTGTLTQNEMTVTRVCVSGRTYSVTGRGYAPKGEFSLNEHVVDPTDDLGLYELGRAVVLCNDAKLEEDDEDPDGWRMVGDPTEGALSILGAKMGLWQAELEQNIPRVDEVPFDSRRKRMSTIHRMPDGEYRVYVKGAPEILVDLCDRVYEDGKIVDLTEERRESILERNAELASQALRVLGAAYRPLAERPEKAGADSIEHSLIFLGLAGMIDPARPEVRDAIMVARKAGIRTAMVTGDYEKTAVAIAKELGLLSPEDDDGQHVLSGRDLDQLSDEELDAGVNRVSVYARVSPEHKVRIVDAHKRRGHIVAMTGDGVNDAPALKRASIGVAMGITGTDVSKETADMVLTDDNYASIVSAVEQGRIIFSNIRKFVYFLLSCNTAEIATLFTAMLVGWPLPLTPLQILVLNLVTDGAPALALGMEKGEPHMMDRQPRPVDEPIINGRMVGGTIVQTIAMAGATLAAYRLGMLRTGRLEEARTMAYFVLSASQLFRAYTARSERYPLFRMGLFSNSAMQWAVFVSLGVLLATIYIPGVNTTIFDTIPLDAGDWLISFPLMLVPAIAAELHKIIALRLAGESITD